LRVRVTADLLLGELARLQVRLGVRFLAHDGVEKIAVLGHARAGRGGPVSLRMHEEVAGVIGGDVEELADQGLRAVEQVEGFQFVLGNPKSVVGSCTAAVSTPSRSATSASSSASI